MTEKSGGTKANPWIRLYREALHDPKIVTLSDRQHRAWHNCLLIADDCGALPPLRDIAVHMRMSTTDAQQILQELIEAELVDPIVEKGKTTYRMHGWAKRQYVSDSSAERTRKYREKKKVTVAVTGNERHSDGDVTPPDFRLQTSESDTDSEIAPTTSESKSARANEQFLNIDFGEEGWKGKIDPELIARAEGLGLAVGDLVDETRKRAKKNHNAYFRTLARNRIRAKIPTASESLVDSALKGNREAWTMVTLALIAAEPEACS